MSDSLAFLISDVSRLMRRRFDERAQRIGVTRAQWRTLSMLKRNEGINQGGLAELLEVEPITACRMIDRLEEAGLVERRRDPSDRRAWRLYLTDKAQPLLAQLRVLAEDLQDDALAAIPQRDRTALADLLAAIHTNLSVPTPSDHETAHG